MLARACSRALAKRAHRALQARERASRLRFVIIVNPNRKARTMTHNDDIRYMSHEQRIAEGFMPAPAIKRDVPAHTCCPCGKTVTHTHGVPVRNPWGPGFVTCPRRCA